MQIILNSSNTLWKNGELDYSGFKKLLDIAFGDQGKEILPRAWRPETSGPGNSRTASLAQPTSPGNLRACRHSMKLRVISWAKASEEAASTAARAKDNLRDNNYLLKPETSIKRPDQTPQVFEFTKHPYVVPKFNPAHERVSQFL